MTSTRDVELDLWGYLLGECSAEEQEALDERAFLEDAFDEQRSAAADELIEAYLAGRLGKERRERFESHFLAAAVHRDRYRLLSQLRTGARQTPEERPGAWDRRLLWAVAAAVLLALGTLALFARQPKPADPRLAVVPTPEPTASARPSPTAGPTTAPRTRTATVALPERSRAVAVALAADVRAVRFQVPLPAERAPSYTATLTRAGREVWRQEDVVRTAEGTPLDVTVPADVLAAGDVALSIEPEALRSASPRPASSARTWSVRISR
jgi:hypothetical protein